MKQLRHIDPMTPRLRNISVILGLIDDLNGVIRILDCEIAAEQGKVRPAQSVYPTILARVLASRREKLHETIGTLEKRLAHLRGPQD